MKKIIAALTAVFMIAAQTAVFAGNAEIIIDGKKAEISEEMGSVVLKDDRTFVPVRFVLENFGYDVSWSSEDKLVLGRNKAGDVFVMQVGSPLLIFKGADGTDKNEKMDVTPFLNETEGRTYIPIRFLAETLGYKVGYNDADKTVTLDKEVK